MEPIGKLLEPMNGMISTESGKSSSAEPPALDYWDAYERPGNSIRRKDEEDGIHVHEDADGVKRFCCNDLETLQAGASDVINGLPEPFRGRTFDTFRTELYAPQHRTQAETALRRARAFAEHFEEVVGEHHGRGLYIWARTSGCGKTHLGCCVGNYLAAEGRRVRWFTQTGLLQELRAGFSAKDGSIERIIASAKRADLLILDDIGSEKVTDWVNETLFDIVNERMKRGAPTLYTSNIAPAELPYEPRTVDRIVSQSVALPLPEEPVRRLFGEAGKADLLRLLDGE